MMPDMKGMEMSENDVRADLLEKLMELMDGRIAGGAMPDIAGKKGNATIEIAIGPGGDSEEDANPDQDPELDDEMKQLIKAKRGY